MEVGVFTLLLRELATAYEIVWVVLRITDVDVPYTSRAPNDIQMTNSATPC